MRRRLYQTWNGGEGYPVYVAWFPSTSWTLKARLRLRWRVWSPETWPGSWRSWHATTSVRFLFVFLSFQCSLCNSFLSLRRSSSSTFVYDTMRNPFVCLSSVLFSLHVLTFVSGSEICSTALSYPRVPCYLELKHLTGLNLTLDSQLLRSPHLKNGIYLPAVWTIRYC